MLNCDRLPKIPYRTKKLWIKVIQNLRELCPAKKKTKIKSLLEFTRIMCDESDVILSNKEVFIQAFVCKE